TSWRRLFHFQLSHSRRPRLVVGTNPHRKRLRLATIFKPMNKELLRKHVVDYFSHLKSTPEKYATELKERADRSAYYRSWTAAKLAMMTKDDLTEYLSKLWAMRIWGNKQYVVDHLVADNT